VDLESGLVHAHGLLAATPMSRIRDAVVAFVVDAGATPGCAEAAVDQAWDAPDPVALARPVTDLGALLARLRPRVGLFAVATSDDRDPTIRTLKALGIAGEFAALACADDGNPTKPAPDPVLRLCERLGVLPDRTAVVGDSPADLRMGRAAGVARTIAVLTGVGDIATLEPLADIVLPSIEDLARA
jgi:phosphoglycolate phosphatase-like HAD superfamily hydrolase